MAAVAIAAGLSKSAVSLALRDDPRIAPATRARIQRIAASLDYQRNPVVAALMSQLRTASHSPPPFIGTLALISNSAQLPALSNLRTIAADEGFSIDHLQLDPSTSQRRLDDIIQARGILGVITDAASPYAFPSLPSVSFSSTNLLPASFAVLVTLIRIRSKLHAALAGIT